MRSRLGVTAAGLGVASLAAMSLGSLMAAMPGMATGVYFDEPAGEPAPKTYTQADIDAIIAERDAAARERDDFKGKHEASEKAKLGDKERAEKERDDAKADAEKSREALKDTNLRLEVERQARRLNIVDEDAAYRLLDIKAVKYDADGKPTNVEALLKTLIETRSYLVAADDGGANRGGGSSNPNRQRGGGTLTQADLKRMTPQQVAQLSAADVAAAMSRQ